MDLNERFTVLSDEMHAIVGYFSNPVQKTNGCQYHVQMKIYSQFSGYISYKRPSEKKPDRTPTLLERCLHRVSKPVKYSFKDSQKARKTVAVSTVLAFCWCVFEYSTATEMLPIRL